MLSYYTLTELVRYTIYMPYYGGDQNIFVRTISEIFYFFLNEYYVRCIFKGNKL